MLNARWPPLSAGACLGKINFSVIKKDGCLIPGRDGYRRRTGNDLITLKGDMNGRALNRNADVGLVITGALKVIMKNKAVARICFCFIRMDLLRRVVVQKVFGEVYTNSNQQVECQ